MHSFLTRSSSRRATVYTKIIRISNENSRVLTFHFAHAKNFLNFAQWFELVAPTLVNFAQQTLHPPFFSHFSNSCDNCTQKFIRSSFLLVFFHGFFLKFLLRSTRVSKDKQRPIRSFQTSRFDKIDPNFRDIGKATSDATLVIKKYFIFQRESLKARAKSRFDNSIISLNIVNIDAIQHFGRYYFVGEKTIARNPKTQKCFHCRLFYKKYRKIDW